jgi:mono/diheme cytochrome c family protein
MQGTCMRISLTWAIVCLAASWEAVPAATAATKAGAAVAAEPAITIGSEGGAHTYTASQLLARPDVASVAVPGDVSYRRAMTYRAVPLLKLLGATPGQKFDTLEAHAKDGFIAQIPLSLLTRGDSGGAVPWLAVEDPTHPWPTLPHGTASAGPFYLVWEHPQQSGVGSEQWPYQLVSLSFAESPVHRWPQLALPASHASDAQAVSGQKVFLTTCLPCHRLNGGGAGAVGPDLGRPMNVTQYMTESGLRAIVRDPKAVRTWPEQHMSGFGEKTVPPADLDALIVFLRAMADVKTSPAP